MKKAFFLILDEYADWEGAYLASSINQREDWSVHTISLEQMEIHMFNLDRRYP